MEINEPTDAEIREALAQLEQNGLDGLDDLLADPGEFQAPTPERAIVYWWGEWRREQMRREMAEKALRDEQERHEARKAELRRWLDQETARADRWRNWAWLACVAAPLAARLVAVLIWGR